MIGTVSGPVTDLLDRPGRLAFDHRHILRDGIGRARAKLEYTALATVFCPAQFTVAELRRVYEVVWRRSLDPRNFHRKVTGTPGFLAPTRQTTTRDGGRPARLFEPGAVRVPHPRCCARMTRDPARSCAC